MHRLRLVVALLIVAAACSEASPATTTSPPPTTAPSATAAPPETAPPQTSPPEKAPVESGEVVVAIESIGAFTFNPLHPERSLPPGLGDAYLTGAWMRGDGGDRLPLVATEIPTTNNGGVMLNDDGTMVVTYAINPEATWSDGTPITGEDFVFTFNLISDAPALLQFERSAYDLTLSVASSGDIVTATLAHPTILYLDLFEVLVPHHAVEGTDFLEDWNTAPWPSGGPFVLEDADDQLVPGARLTFVANDSYWMTNANGDELPRLDRVVFELQGDPAVTKDRFASGEINVWEAPPWPPLLAGAASSGETVDTTSSAIWEHFAFNFGVNNANSSSLNANLNYRRAVAHAIDREALIADSPWGAREILDSPFELYGLGNESWGRYSYDPERARELLAVACEQEGRDCAVNPPRLVFSTTSNADERPRIGRKIVEQLAEVGIAAEFDGQDSALFFGDTINKGTFDVGMWAWVLQGGLSNALYAVRLFDPASPPPQFQGGNFTRYGTPAVTDADDPLFNQPASIIQDESTTTLAEIIDALGRTVDLAEFAGLLFEAEELLADQVVFIPFVARGQAVAFRGVDGVIAATGLPPTWNIEEWSLP